MFCVSFATVSNKKRGLFLLTLIKEEKYLVRAVESACLYCLKLTAQARRSLFCFVTRHLRSSFLQVCLSERVSSENHGAELIWVCVLVLTRATGL